jgi:hypothetical protein
MATADLNACSLSVSNNAVVVIPTGFDVTLYGALTVESGSTFTLESGAGLIQSSDAANSGNIQIKRKTIPLKRLDYVLWSSPADGQNLLAFSPATMTDRFYIYNTDTDLYNSVPSPGTATFETGKGYLIRMPNNHPTTPTIFTGNFTGVPHNGTVNVAVEADKYNAVGNPYPSAIDADSFITTNNLAEPLYFWRKTNNSLNTSYATYTLAGGVGTDGNTGGDPNILVPDGDIQVGQGFLVKAPASSLSFTNAMRSTNNQGVFLRQTGRSRVWLNMTNTQGIFSQIMIAYMADATPGVDAGIDGLLINDSQTAFYSTIGEGDYAIQGRPLPFDVADVVPLGFKTESSGNYTIAIDHVDGLFAQGQPVYLKDNVIGNTHDLTVGPYTFGSDAGIFDNRFEILYSSALTAGDQPWDANQVIAYKSGRDIAIHTGTTEIKSVMVFDVSGRLIARKENVNATETKVVTDAPPQMLILRITAANNTTVVKKIVY